MLVIAGDCGLYFSHFKTCIMPNKKPNPEGHEKNEKTDPETSAMGVRMIGRGYLGPGTCHELLWSRLGRLMCGKALPFRVA
jgi:hypothetical protein